MPLRMGAVETHDFVEKIFAPQKAAKQSGKQKEAQG
jgi:hypothetical protein